MEKSKVLILGSTNLYNELIAHVLDIDIGIPCSIVEDILDLSNDDNNRDNNNRDDGKELILIDSVENNFEEILTYLESQNNGKDSQQIIALFNLSRDMGIENDGLRRGIKGFFYKQDNLKLFLKGIHTLFDGEVWLSRDILVNLAMQSRRASTVDAQKKAGLTHREMEILALVSLGSKNDKIADELFISPHTVKTHLYNVYKKIGVDNRLQAALWAYLFRPPPIKKLKKK